VPLFTETSDLMLLQNGDELWLENDVAVPVDAASAGTTVTDAAASPAYVRLATSAMSAIASAVATPAVVRPSSVDMSTVTVTLLSDNSVVRIVAAAFAQSAATSVAGSYIVPVDVDFLSTCDDSLVPHIKFVGPILLSFDQVVFTPTLLASSTDVKPPMSFVTTVVTKLGHS
jgi:hypothetical protein